MTVDGITRGMIRRRRKWGGTTAFLCIFVIALALLLLMVGNTNYSMGTVLQVVRGAEIEGASFAIGIIRLPRMLAGLLVGMAFGIAGSTFQTILRNPLASPDIIGVTSGSSAAAVFMILVLNMSGLVVSVAAVAFGLLISGLIYFLSKGGQFSGGRLILIGIGVQAMLNSFIGFLLLKANQYDVPGAMRWLSGSLNTMRMEELTRLFLAVLVFGTVIALLNRHLEIMELGEASAISLGIRTDMTRILLIGSAVCLTAFATSVAGPIAFVAFLSGPIAKRLVGTGSSHVVPSGLLGALLVLSADFIGQYGLPIRLPVGVVTGILGAPYLIWLLIRMNKSGGAA